MGSHGRQIGRQKTGCATPGLRRLGCRQEVDKSVLADFASSARAHFAGLHCVPCARAVLQNRRPPGVGAPDCRAGWAGQNSGALGRRDCGRRPCGRSCVGAASVRVVALGRMMAVGDGPPEGRASCCGPTRGAVISVQPGERPFAVQREVLTVGEPLEGRICAAQVGREVPVLRAPLVPSWVGRLSDRRRCCNPDRENK